jgi:hypothetical protein
MTTATGTMRLLVDVDVVVRRDHGEERVRARHAWYGSSVHAVSASGAEVESAVFDVAHWQEQLARTCRVAAPPSTSPPPGSGLEVPWDLVIGTGAALARHRPDLYEVLVARADGSVTADGRRLGQAAVHTQMLRLHRAVVGRLRCTGTVASARRVGWVSWLLYPDGWRALTPYAGDPVAGADGARPMVRLERRSPDDLAHDVARWGVAP